MTEPRGLRSRAAVVLAAAVVALVAGTAAVVIAILELNHVLG
jgi:hypothetical protein